MHSRRAARSMVSARGCVLSISSASVTGLTPFLAPLTSVRLRNLVVSVSGSTYVSHPDWCFVRRRSIQRPLARVRACRRRSPAVEHSPPLPVPGTQPSQTQLRPQLRDRCRRPSFVPAMSCGSHASAILPLALHRRPNPCGGKATVPRLSPRCGTERRSMVGCARVHRAGLRRPGRPRHGSPASHSAG